MQKIVLACVVGLLWILLALAPLGAFSQQAKLDSLRQVMATAKVDTVKGRAWRNLTQVWMEAGQLDSARASALQAMRLSRSNWRTAFDCSLAYARLLSKANELNHSLKLYRQLVHTAHVRQSNYHAVEALTPKGHVHYVLGQFDSATTCFAEAMNRLPAQGSTMRRGHLLSELGTVRQAQGDYSRAIGLHLEALALAEKLKDQRLQLMCNGNLGSVYGYLRQHQQAETYFRRAYALATDSADRARMLTNLGGTLSEQKRYAEGTAYLEQALAIYQRLNLFLEQLYALNNLGVNYDDQNQYPEAERYYGQALSLARQIGDTPTTAIILTNLARICLMQGQPQKSSQLAREGLSMARNTQYGEALRAAWREVYRADSALVNWKGAFEAHKQFKSIADSLVNNEKAREIGRLEAQYEAQKDRELLETRQQAQLQQRNWLVGSAGVGLLVALVVAYTLFRSRQKAKEANAALRLLNEQINQQKAEIEAQNSEIISQRDQLEGTNSRLVRLDRMKEELSGMIVHDLKNPLNAVLAMASLPPETGRLHVIRGAGQQMANLVSNLLDVQKYESDALQLQPEPVAAREILQAATEQTDFLALQKNIRFDIQAPPDLLVEADRELLVRVCVNLLTNAIKYAPNGDTLILEAVRDAERGAMFRITDHGRGIPADQVESIFDKYAQVDGGRASGRLRSTGLGLTFCKLTVEAHGGSIRARSEAGKYTTMEFNLPVARLETGAARHTVAQPESVAVGPLPVGLQSQHAETLDRLRHLPPYELTAVLDALEALPDTPQELRAWKSAIEAAVLSADAVRLRELLYQSYCQTLQI